MEAQPEEPLRLKQLQAEIRYLMASAEDHSRQLKQLQADLSACSADHSRRLMGLEHKLTELETRLNLTNKES